MCFYTSHFVINKKYGKNLLEVINRWQQIKTIGEDVYKLIDMFLDEYIYIHIIEKFGRAQVEGSVDSRFSKGSFVDHRYRKINKWGLTGWGQDGVIQITKPDSADNWIIKRLFAGIYANIFSFFKEHYAFKYTMLKF